jgi:large subunit ribosomal protein L10
MDNPRPAKVAVVDEVRDRLTSSSAALLTEYRGLTVTDMQVLRRSLREAGGDYKIYKNSLVRFAARDLGLEIEDLLLGPTAIAFIPSDGGDPVPVAKVLKEFSKGNANLVVKGGVLGDRILSADDAKALADVASRETLLSQLAGAMAAPMQQFAGLLNALPQNFAYAMQALIDQGGAPGAPQAEAPATEAPPEAEASDTAEAPDAEAPGAAEAAPTDQTDAPETDQTDAPETDQTDTTDMPAASDSSSDAGASTTEES